MSIDSRRLIVTGLGTALAVTALAGTSHAAEGPRYTYGQLAYVELDFDDLDADGDGFAVSGSAAVADMVHLFASYTDGDIDVDGFGFDVSADYTELDVGVGLNYAVSETMDIVGRVAYVDAEVEVDALGFSASDDESGYGLSGGLRAMITPEFELNGGISYVDLGDDADDTAFEVGAVYNFTDMFAVVGGASFSDDGSTYGIGARFYFGDR